MKRYYVLIAVIAAYLLFKIILPLIRTMTQPPVSARQHSGQTGALGGNIDIHGTSITGSLPHIRSGRLRVLGVMDSKRMPQVPEALTFKEQGFDLEATLWYSLSVPAATPKDVIQRLNRAVNDVIADPQFVEQAQAIGMEPRGGTPEQLAKFIQVEADRWLPVLQSLNLPKQGR